MPARLSAFVIWALVAASAAFWGLRLAVQSAPIPPHSIAMPETVAARGDLTRLLGAPPAATRTAAAAPEASSRFRLLGIVAPHAPHSHEGVALIAIDGKPARAFAVGATIDGDLVLQSVSLRTASLGSARESKTMVLEVPRLPAAATGTLPPPGAPAAPGAGLPPPGAPAAPVPGLPPPLSSTVPMLPSPANANPPTALPPGAPGIAPPTGMPAPNGMPPGLLPGVVPREGSAAQ
jgi:general secretion pathway protein C